jgi:hypothetical protein
VFARQRALSALSATRVASSADHDEVESLSARNQRVPSTPLGGDFFSEQDENELSWGVWDVQFG